MSNKLSADEKECLEQSIVLLQSMQSPQIAIAALRDKIDRSDNEENELKFYYCESEDSYLLGERVGNFYYAHYRPEINEFVWDMSRNLPWGKPSIYCGSTWNEYIYPSEPVEIHFTMWISGFINKYFKADMAKNILSSKHTY